MYDELNELIAFCSASGPPVPVAPAGRKRAWIEAMGDAWAYRCLPLVLASEAGWVLLNPYAFEASWNGDSKTSGISIRFDEERPGHAPVQSHFGYGIMTWAVPFLFRTPPGWNLLVRGPANWPKDGIAALEGLVETDWSVATFTMNWKFTRPGHTVRFEADEPFCMIVPQRRGELEAFRPVFRALGAEPEVEAATKVWADSRHESQVRKFLAEYSKEYAGELSSWQQHYYRGEAPDGRRVPTHQTRLRLAEFTGEARE